MKRLLIRTSALTFVVVLGVIAIAHAQREPETAAVTPAYNNEQLSEPRRLPTGDLSNPLREYAQATELAADQPASRVQPTSAESEITTPLVAPISAPSDPFNAPVGSASTPPPPQRLSSPPTMAPPSVATAPPSTLPPWQPTPNTNTIAANTPQDIPSYTASATPLLSPTIAGGASNTGLAAPRELASSGSVPSPSHQTPTLSAPITSSISPANPYASSPGMPESPRSLASASQQIGVTGTGLPGAQLLEGPQVPQLTVQKTAPAEIQVGQPAVFVIEVRNSGHAPASSVEIRDEIPKGTRLVKTEPRATRGAGGELIWSVGAMQPGETVSVQIVIEPIQEGEIGSVATVHFQAEASARTRATQPRLAIAATMPRHVLIGEEVLMDITISNSGSGVATGVVLEETLPAGLQHPAGAELEYDVGDLAPGQSRNIQLSLKAIHAGEVINHLIARAEGNLKAEEQVPVEVIAPAINVAIDGPSRRYLERKAVYSLSINNPGTAPAREVELVAYLPDGLKFEEADNYGQYEEATHSVHWFLEELPVGEPGSVSVSATPVQLGDHMIRVAGTDDSGIHAEREQSLLVEGIAAISFEVVDLEDPIEAGGETTYEIRVLNQGTKEATNVRLATILPPGMEVVGAEGPSRYQVLPGRLMFEPLARLAPKADTTYRIRVRAMQAGDQRFNVQLTTDDIREPIIKQESTRVYSDG